MIGQRLKNYVVEEMLGKGGMGAVYRARDTKLDRNVAIKVLPPELMRDPERRRRFVREARAASAVNHPAIAQIYEIEEEAEIPFIAMEFVDGSTVRQLVGRGELDLLSAVEIGIQVGEGLASAHAAGIVHRDIKSDNIMVTRDGHPKILDFGLAKLLHSDSIDPEVTRAETMALTQAGVVLGTVAYMSPEQARGMPADHRSDIFSFGIVLYEMATGKLPFLGQSALDTMHAIAFGQTEPISAIRSDLPWSLQGVVDRCLRKDPDQRYQSLTDAVADLRRVRRQVESGVSGGMPILERVRRLSRGLRLPAGLTTRGLVVIGVWGVLLGTLLLVVLVEGKSPAGAMPFLVIGFIVYAHVRGRRSRMVRRFARKAAKLKEVRLVRIHGDEFTVLVENPKASTYVKLNALLDGANDSLYYGPPLGMQVKDGVAPDEVQKLVTQTGIQFLRE